MKPLLLSESDKYVVDKTEQCIRSVNCSHTLASNDASFCGKCQEMLKNDCQKLYRQSKFIDNRCNLRFMRKECIVLNITSRLELKKKQVIELAQTSRFKDLHRLLLSAEKKGSFEERGELLDFVTGVVANTVAKNHGQRWRNFPIVAQLLEAVKITGSTRAATVLGILLGVSTKTVRRISDSDFKFMNGVDATALKHNISHAIEIWTRKRTDLEISPQSISMVNLGYDGTSINQELEFREDRLYGMCGHRADGTGSCDLASMQLPVGTAEETLKITRDLRLAGIIIVYLAVPLDSRLPQCPLAVHPTCGKEDSAAQKLILLEIEKVFKNEILSSVFKIELTTYSTDGDPKVAKMKHANLALSFLQRQGRPGCELACLTFLPLSDLAMIANSDFYHVGKGLVTNVGSDKKKVVILGKGVVCLSLISLAMKDTDSTRFALRPNDLLPINKMVTPPSPPFTHH